MIDHTSITISSGCGGNGSISGRREKFVPRGGPDGGHGGNGGSCYIYADPNISTLLEFRYRKSFVAENGGHGKGKLKHGTNGADIEIAVPLGTEVCSKRDRSELLADLNTAGVRVMLAKGGKGGRGNSAFASSVNQFPLLAEEGEEGETLEAILELKLLADVGIIGEPNAGKSSLLTAVSQARPKIAEYPFTTLEPVLGVVEWRKTSFVMVDIPGLVEGAHRGVGLGHEFLRHIERTRVLIHVVDGSLGDPVAQIDMINEELKRHHMKLTKLPQIICINKVDLQEARDRMTEIGKEVLSKYSNARFISAATHEGIDGLLDEVSSMLMAVPSRGEVFTQEQVMPILELEPESPRVIVTRHGRKLVVESQSASRVAAMIDYSDWNARAQLYGYLKKTGVLRALEEAGVEEGDTVVLGKREWEWE